MSEIPALDEIRSVLRQLAEIADSTAVKNPEALTEEDRVALVRQIRRRGRVLLARAEDLAVAWKVPSYGEDVIFLDTIGVAVAVIARRLDISRPTVYRILKKAADRKARREAERAQQADSAWPKLTSPFIHRFKKLHPDCWAGLAGMWEGGERELVSTIREMLRPTKDKPAAPAEVARALLKIWDDQGPKV